MTRETALDLLDNLKGMIEDSQGNDYDKAFRMAIEALKREAKLESIAERYKDMPLAEDIYNARAIIERDYGNIESTEPTGHWKRIGKRGEYAYICSQCNHESIYNGNFCPNCGADMREGET